MAIFSDRGDKAPPQGIWATYLSLEATAYRHVIQLAINMLSKSIPAAGGRCELISMATHAPPVPGWPIRGG